MTEYETDEELNYDENVNSNNRSSESEPVNISILINSLNATPVNNFDESASNFSHQRHKHNHACFTAEVFVKGVGFLINKRLKANSPMSNQAERKFLNLTSIDDGFQDDSQSPLISSVCSDRDQGALSDTSSEGFYGHCENSHRCNEEICLHVIPFLNRLKKNFSLPNNEQCPSLPKFNVKFYKSLQQLIQCFEEKFNSDSSTWLRSNSLDINNMDIIKARTELNKIFQSIFSDKINWGRIVAMIGFVCELSCSAFTLQRFDLIEEYITTSVSFVDQNLWNWISQHGGWEGLVEFELGQTSDGVELESIFSNLTRIARVAALALAGVAFCKYVADHI